MDPLPRLQKYTHNVARSRWNDGGGGGGGGSISLLGAQTSNSEGGADADVAVASAAAAAAAAVTYKSVFRRRRESVSVRNSKQKSNMKPFVAVIGDCDLRASVCGATGLGVGVD